MQHAWLVEAGAMLVFGAWQCVAKCRYVHNDLVFACLPLLCRQLWLVVATVNCAVCVHGMMCTARWQSFWQSGWLIELT
jgi:hypothetical protein